MLHLIGDALNNIGVIVSALVIWLTRYDGRYYADPMASMAIAVMILMSSAPLGTFILHLYSRRKFLFLVPILIS
jgi:Co/Zn/Cd efflux system component